jgi:flagellar basal-body rod modification protein FlgD
MAMDAIATTATSGATTRDVPQRANGFEDLGSDDFLKLLITQLVNQDPLEPTGNEELLAQIASIREIELSTAMTSSLKSLTGRQDFASSSALIGQFVTGQPGDDGSRVEGLVIGVSFEADGQAILNLADGRALPLQQVASIQDAGEMVAAMIGQSVSGVDLRNPSSPRAVQGVVTASRRESDGTWLLELDTGEDIRLRDVAAVGPAAANNEPNAKGQGLISRIISGVFGG